MLEHWDHPDLRGQAARLVDGYQEEETARMRASAIPFDPTSCKTHVLGVKEDDVGVFDLRDHYVAQIETNGNKQFMTEEILPVAGEGLVDDIQGMSGGPIFSVATRDEAVVDVVLWGNQSSWLRDERIGRAQSIPSLLRLLDKITEGAN